MEYSIQTDEAEAFARVWKRVEGDWGPSCPIQPTAAEQVPEQAQLAASPEHSLPLGPSSAAQGDFLQKQIRQELRRWRTYGQLSAGDSSIVVLSRQALRRAKRLSAAWLLISGFRFLPISQAAPMTWVCREDGLRLLFRQEQLGQMAYAARAKGNPDPELARLFLDLAEDCAGAQQVIRRVLENIKGYP